MQKSNRKLQRGQSMVLTAFIVGCAVFAISAIGGYIMVLRLRMSSNFVDTTKAIYAADAGIECGLFNKYKSGGIVCEDMTFDDTKTSVTIVTDSDSVKAIGTSNNSNRSLEIGF